MSSKLQMPMTEYYQARYLGDKKEVSQRNLIQNVVITTNPFGRVRVVVKHGYEWQRSGGSARYYTREVMLKDWELIRQVQR